MRSPSLRRTLSVPNIYLEPPANLIAADVLAVDRAGAGDLHAVEIKLFENRPLLGPQGRLLEIISTAYRRSINLPAHFRYLAIPKSSLDILHGNLTRLERYADDGIGRLGIIAITENGADHPWLKWLFPQSVFALTRQNSRQSKPSCWQRAVPISK